jgi:hypothetical protein
MAWGDEDVRSWGSCPDISYDYESAIVPLAVPLILFLFALPLMTLMCLFAFPLIALGVFFAFPLVSLGSLAF